MSKLSEQSPKQIAEIQARLKKNAVPCTEKDCKGIIDFNREIALQTGCHCYTVFFACNTCGRIHDDDGSPVNNRAGDEVFLVDGMLEIRDKD